MKKKWPVRALLALLCIAVFCIVPAYAAESRASERIDMSSVSLSKKSNGDLSIYFSVRATGVMKKIGASSVAIQRSSGSDWVTEYTFTPSNAPEIQAENKFQHNATLTYSPLFTGKEYRAVVMIHAEDTTGVSTKELTSRAVTS